MLKRLLEAVPDPLLLAAAAALDALRRRRTAPAGLALVYHRIAPRAGDPARELLPAIATDELAAQLRWLRRRYRPVRASELREAALDRSPRAALPVAVTFDDDSDTHHAHARAALRAAGVPATFFLCGGTLDGPRGYWFDDLQAAADRDLLREPLPHVEPGPLHAVAAAIEHLPARRHDEVAAELRRRVGAPHHPGLPAAAVRDLATDGHEIGFHTRAHHALPTLDDRGLEAALRDGTSALADVAGAPLTAIAYPNGKYDARTVPAVRAAGFAHGFTTSAAALGARTDALLIGRIEPRSPSLGVFALKLALASWGRA